LRITTISHLREKGKKEATYTIEHWGRDKFLELGPKTASALRGKSRGREGEKKERSQQRIKRKQDGKMIMNIVTQEKKAAVGAWRKRRIAD